MQVAVYAAGEHASSQPTAQVCSSMPVQQLGAQPAPNPSHAKHEVHQLHACLHVRACQWVRGFMPVQQLGAHGGLLGTCGLQKVQPAPNPVLAKHEMHQCMKCWRISAWAAHK
jgi:hypothetical protein